MSARSILTTHHHWDHAGGNAELLKLFPHLPCYGGSKNVDAANHVVKNEESVKVGDLQVIPLETYCHTMDHICYYVQDGEQRAVFTGDWYVYIFKEEDVGKTLTSFFLSSIFSSGCGRFFEGTPADMWKSISTIAKLPDSTQVYFGHEYTVSNLRFAEHVEPDNKETQEKMAWAKRTACTTPSTIQNEKLTNPFFRVESDSVQNSVLGKGKRGPATEVMGKLRQMKDNF